MIGSENSLESLIVNYFVYCIGVVVNQEMIKNLGYEEDG